MRNNNPNANNPNKQNRPNMPISTKDENVCSVQLTKGGLLISAVIFLTGYVIGRMNGRMSVFNQFINRH